MPPMVTHPWLSPCQAIPECTTANPAAQVRTWELAMRVRPALNGTPLPNTRAGGSAPSSCFTGQNTFSLPSVPAKYGLVS